MFNTRAHVSRCLAVKTSAKRNHLTEYLFAKNTEDAHAFDIKQYQIRAVSDGEGEGRKKKGGQKTDIIWLSAVAQLLSINNKYRDTDELLAFPKSSGRGGGGREGRRAVGIWI